MVPLGRVLAVRIGAAQEQRDGQGPRVPGKGGLVQYLGGKHRIAGPLEARASGK